MLNEIVQDLQVPDDVHQYRLRICEKCPTLMREQGQEMKTCRCGDCGCFVYVKSNLKDFTCPKGKW